MKGVIFTWSIWNIGYSWHKEDDYIVSPEFAGPLQHTAWVLKLNPRGSANPDYAGLYLQRRDSDEPMFCTVNVEFSCVFSDASVRYSPSFLEIGKSVASRVKVGHPCFLKRHEVFGRRKAVYLPQDVLTLRCRIWEKDGDIEEFQEYFGRTLLEIERIYSEEKINPAISNEKTVCVRSQLRQEDMLSLRTVYRENCLEVEIIPVNVKGIKFSVCQICLVDTRTRVKLCEFVYEQIGRPRPEIWQLPFANKALSAESAGSHACDFQFFSWFVYSTGKEEKTIENNRPLKNLELLSIYVSRIIPSGKLCDRQTLCEHLTTLYVCQKHCDMEIGTKTTSLGAHKFVLCARSPVFRAMLTSGMREDQRRCIEIGDIEDDTLKLFVLCLYTDAFANPTWGAVVKLYRAANRYFVERLKLLCCSYLLRNVRLENVCELLLLSDESDDRDFQARVEDIIWKNDETVFKSPEWKAFVEDEPSLALKTVLSKYQQRENCNLAETYDAKLSSQPNALDDFRSLYESQISTDVSIKIAGKTLRAHKTVLCASSESLREDLEIDLDTLEIKDMEYNTFARLLPCLYSDDYLQDLQWESASELYHAAIVLRIQRLKFNCSYYLLENLRVFNAIDLLLLARAHDDDQLQSIVQDFICLHDEEIFGSDEWAGFCKANCRLANAIMCAKYKQK